MNLRFAIFSVVAVKIVLSGLAASYGPLSTWGRDVTMGTARQWAGFIFGAYKNSGFACATGGKMLAVRHFG